MTTDLKLPIRIDVVQKQYKNGMKLKQLAQLYDVSEETLRPLVADIVPKTRKNVQEETLASEIRELAEKEKMSKYAIAEVLAKPTSKIERVARDYNIVIPVRSRAEIEMKPTEPTVPSTESKRRGPKPQMSDADMAALAERVRELVTQGLSISAIGRELGYPYSRIRQVMTRYAIPAMKTKHDPTRLTKDEWQQRLEAIKVMAGEGKCAAEIGRHYDITRSYVTRMCKKHGIKLNAKIGRPKKNENEPDAKQLKEEPTMPDVTTASLESAVTAFKAEEVSEVIGKLDERMEREKRIEQRVLNRDKAVWGDYLSARSEEIEDVTHNVEVLVENGKLIERTTIAYTLERELGR